MASMDWRHDLLTLSDSYRQARGLSESRVASLVGGTGIFFRRIRAGGDCSATVYERALRWFADHWPENTPWPEKVPRPRTLDSAATPDAERVA